MISSRCRAIAKRLLLLIEKNGQTYETALEIDRRIGLLFCKDDGTWGENESYCGLIEAKCSLILPMLITLAQRSGDTPEQIREHFPRWETSLPAGWAECLMVLREVSGLQPLQVFVRDRQMDVRRWRYLIECNVRSAAEGKVYPPHTNEEIIALAKKRYPDLDVAEIMP